MSAQRILHVYANRFESVRVEALNNGRYTAADLLLATRRQGLGVNFRSGCAWIRPQTRKQRA